MKKRQRIFYPKLYERTFILSIFSKFPSPQIISFGKEALSHNCRITETLIQWYVFFEENTLAGNTTKKCVVLLLMKRLWS